MSVKLSIPVKLGAVLMVVAMMLSACGEPDANKMDKNQSQQGTNDMKQDDVMKDDMKQDDM